MARDASQSPMAADLRERFSTLFSQLAKEEDILKNLLSQNELMEQQLHAVRRSRRSFFFWL